MLPVCNHASYFDGQCLLINDNWYLSYPPHDKAHTIPLSVVQGAYFYSTYGSMKYSLQNILTTHRWATNVDGDGDTFCAKPNRREQNFIFGGFKFVRTAVKGRPDGLEQ